MKNLHSHSQSHSKVFLYKKTAEKSSDAHEKISSGVRTVSDAPFQAASYVSDKVHNVVSSVAGRAPIVGKPLTYVVDGSKVIVKAGLNASKGLVGGVAEGASNVVTHSVEAGAKGVAKTAGGIGKSAKGLVLHKSTTSDREKKDLQHGNVVRAKKDKRKAARKAKRVQRRAQKSSS